MFQHLKGAALFGVLEGGFQKVDRIYSAKETAKRPVAGTSFVALNISLSVSCRIIKSMTFLYSLQLQVVLIMLQICIHAENHLIVYQLDGVPCMSFSSPTIGLLHVVMGRPLLSCATHMVCHVHCF